MKSILLIAVCSLLLVTQSGHAIQVSGLYQSTVPVGNESASARKPALKQALIKVLIKLTGDRNISKSSATSSLIERPDRFVQQFRYNQVVDQENPEVQSSELWVQFDENALNEALRSYGLNIWGKERPSVLVWLANEINQNRVLVSFEESPEYLSMLEHRASARGIALLFPLLDLEDTSKISVSDVWGSFKDPILEASTRYQSDVVLTGKLIQTLPTLWESEWLAYINGEAINWTSQGELPEIVLEEGIDELVDRIAAQYASTGSTRSEILEMRVTNIIGLDEYARTLSYLESLQSVSKVHVKRVSKNEVVFELISHSGVSAMNQTIALGKTLELVSDNQQLTYRLLTR
jgi:uncharacterized protein